MGRLPPAGPDPSRSPSALSDAKLKSPRASAIVDSDASSPSSIHPSRPFPRTASTEARPQAHTTPPNRSTFARGTPEIPETMVSACSSACGPTLLRAANSIASDYPTVLGPDVAPSVPVLGAPKSNLPNASQDAQSRWLVSTSLRAHHRGCSLGLPLLRVRGNRALHHGPPPGMLVSAARPLQMAGSRARQCGLDPLMTRRVDLRAGFDDRRTLAGLNRRCALRVLRLWREVVRRSSTAVRSSSGHYVRVPPTPDSPTAYRVTVAAAESQTHANGGGTGAAIISEGVSQARLALRREALGLVRVRSL